MKKYGMVVFSLLLAACGFHLKGTVALDAPMPYQIWSVQGGALQNALTNTLRRQPGVQIRDNDAEVVVKVLNVDQRKTESAVNLSGSTSEYLLDLNVSVQVYRNGQPLGDTMLVNVQRHMDYADSMVLGKQEEEQTIWREMRQDAAEQIVRRLNYLPTPQ